MNARRGTKTGAIFALLALICGSVADAETYEYDRIGRLTRVRYDDGTSIAYDYDPHGNLLARRVNASEAPVFHRGDANADGALDVGDVIFNLVFLFRGGAAPGTATRAARRGSRASIAAIATGHTTRPGARRTPSCSRDGASVPPPPGPPGETCGPDPTSEGDALDCGSYPSC